jgi:hypothetical protein
MDFYSLFPGLEPWVQSLGTIWPGSTIKNSIWLFAATEAVHLLALSLLGGCVLLLNLRLLGVGLVTETPASLERTLRPAFHVAVVVIMLTGIAMGMSNAEKLYTSPSFYVKMLSLIAGLLFSFGVANTLARGNGEIRLGLPAQIMGFTAFGFWLWSVGVFSAAPGSNPGTVHLITAGYLLLFLFGEKTRLPAAVSVVFLLVAGWIHTHLPFDPFEDFALIDATNIFFVRLAAILLVLMLAYEIFIAGRNDPTKMTARLVATFSILTWVTVAAAGRWIGLS